MESVNPKLAQEAQTFKRDQEVKSVALFVRAAVRIGCKYLSAGGPTSRLEEQLTTAGQRLGYKTEVFTTPTGIFVSALIPSKQRVVTFVGRVKEVSFSMTELEQTEGLLQKLAQGEVSPEETLEIVKALNSNPSAIDHSLQVVGAFLIGFIAALFSYGSVLISSISGLITVLIYFLSGPVSSHFSLNPVFSNFASAIVGFSLSAIAAYSFDISMQAVSLGSLIILAPGLMITTAISEIAEQNYVSGIAKLMKSSIHLCGMLVSYLVILDVVNALGVDLTHSIAPVGDVIPYSFLKYIFYGILVMGMCFSLQVPTKALPGALMASFASWMVFNLFENPAYYVSATYLATLSVGLISLAFGLFMKLPSQIFSTPGILALVPGVLAMSSFHTLAGLDAASLQVGLKVILIASAIVFGLFTARMPFLMKSKQVFGLEPDLELPPNDVRLEPIAESNKKATIAPNSDAAITIF